MLGLMSTVFFLTPPHAEPTASAHASVRPVMVLVVIMWFLLLIARVVAPVVDRGYHPICKARAVTRGLSGRLCGPGSRASRRARHSTGSDRPGSSCQDRILRVRCPRPGCTSPLRCPRGCRRYNPSECHP